VLSSSVSVVDSVRDLGVVIDSRLTMSDHVTALCRSRYYQLRQLRPVTRALHNAAAKTLVQAFISCQLDYCNALLSGITDNLSRRLQSIQNAAARLLTDTGRRDHISPVLSRLHLLPVKQRVVFKLAIVYILVFKSLRAKPLRTSRMIASSLLTPDAVVCARPTPTLSLFRKLTLGSETGVFLVTAPKVWNFLPATLRKPDI